MRVEDTTAEIIVGMAARGHGVLHDLRQAVGPDRAQAPIVWATLTLVLLFPLFWVIGARQPGAQCRRRRAGAGRRIGADCSYSVWFAPEQKTPCAKLLADLGRGSQPTAAHGESPNFAATVGGKPLPLDQLCLG
jgi:hypothetical protein